jgi:hypothetical protein
MKTIVSLALAGLMSISALLPALAAQEAESVSIPESSGISESVAQDESGVSSSSSTADESTAPESGSNAGADVSQPESDSMPVESDGSTSDGSEAETSSSLPVSDSMASDEMDADSEPASGSETAESDVDAKDEDSSGVTAATADEQSVSVTVSEEYAILLATNQADSMMGHAGMRRSSTCKQLVESFILADYTADNEENAYKLLWAALNQAIVSLSEEGGGIGHCVYGSGTIRLYR